jgi:CubicO group peptidase (beta-lactamase class C family)
MYNKTYILLILTLLFSSKLFSQFVDSVIHNEVKDSIIARFNRSDFKSIYQFADTTSFNTSEQKLTRFLTSYKRNFGQIINSKFVADSVCDGCNSKRATYYLVEFQLQSFLMILEVNRQKKFTSFGLLNYTYPERTAVATIKTNNALITSFDRSIDSAAREYFLNPNVEGLSIGVIKNGKRFTYHYGEKIKGKGRLPTNNTLYELGSIGKTFTSTILANAVLEKRVNLKDDVRKYLPESYPNLEYDGQVITLQDLSNHTSGIPSIPDDFFTNAYFDPLIPWKNYSIAMFRAFLHRVTLDTIPGYKERYSNSGVALLGYILENIYHSSFDSLLKNFIFRPFGMKHTTTTLDKTGKKNLASKYSANGKLVPYWSSSPYTPAGDGIVTCLNDMLNYVEAQISEADPAIKLTHQLTVNNMGLGWGIGNIGTKYKKYEHSGGTNGFSTNVRIFPEIKAGMVILANNDVNLATLIRRISSLVVQQ